MTGIAWQSAFETGRDDVDAGNRRLLRLVNGIHDRLMDDSARRRVMALLAELQPALDRQFRCEGQHLAGSNPTVAEALAAAQRDARRELDILAHQFAQGPLIGDKWLLRKRFIRWFGRYFKGPAAAGRAALAMAARQQAA